jgi:hypothetical protein
MLHMYNDINTKKYVSLLQASAFYLVDITGSLPQIKMLVLESEHLPHSTGDIFLLFIPCVITDIRFMILNQQQTCLCILLV